MQRIAINLGLAALSLLTSYAIVARWPDTLSASIAGVKASAGKPAPAVPAKMSQAGRSPGFKIGMAD
jgi:hypothetical protein